MIHMKKAFSFLLIAILAIAIMNIANAQRTFYAVYEGQQYFNGIRYDYVFLFRKNGTFCDHLGAPDWETRVDGRYEINNGKILMRYNNNKIGAININGNTGTYAGAVMVRLAPCSTVADGTYNFTMTMGGGYGGGTVYRSITFRNAIHRFSHFGFSATQLNGGIKGGTVRPNNNGEGVFQLYDGELTLLYDNGKKIKHSFFSDGKVAAIDGKTYFLNESNNKRKRF